MSNTARKVNVKLSVVMGSASFRDGMKDARDGKPIRDHWEADTKYGVTNEQWSYERGRQFYAWLKSVGLESDPIKQGRTVLMWAQLEYARARKIGAIL